MSATNFNKRLGRLEETALPRHLVVAVFPNDWAEVRARKRVEETTALDPRACDFLIIPQRWPAIAHPEVVYIGRDFDFFQGIAERGRTVGAPDFRRPLK